MTMLYVNLIHFLPLYLFFLLLSHRIFFHILLTECNTFVIDYMDAD